MELGIFDHLDERPVPLHEHYESRLRLLERYDAAGFAAYHLAEHHATPLGLAPAPGIFLAAAGQRTRRIRLGPWSLPFSLHPPGAPLPQPWRSCPTQANSVSPPTS